MKPDFTDLSEIYSIEFILMFFFIRVSSCQGAQLSTAIVDMTISPLPMGCVGSKYLQPRQEGSSGSGQFTEKTLSFLRTPESAQFTLMKRILFQKPRIKTVLAGKGRKAISKMGLSHICIWESANVQSITDWRKQVSHF